MNGDNFRGIKPVILTGVLNNPVCDVKVTNTNRQELGWELGLHLTLTSDMEPPPAALAPPVTADSKLKLPEEDLKASRICWWP